MRLLALPAFLKSLPKILSSISSSKHSIVNYFQCSDKNKTGIYIHSVILVNDSVIIHSSLWERLREKGNHETQGQSVDNETND